MNPEKSTEPDGISKYSEYLEALDDNELATSQASLLRENWAGFVSRFDDKIWVLGEAIIIMLRKHIQQHTNDHQFQQNKMHAEIYNLLDLHVPVAIFGVQQLPLLLSISQLPPNFTIPPEVLTQTPDW